MTLKNNRAPLLCCFKLCASFHSHQWIQTGVRVRNGSKRVKIVDFLARVTLKFDWWPWKTKEHLSYTNSSFVHNFIAISKFKLELESGNAPFGSKFLLTSLTLTFDRSPWPFAWISLLAMVITPENFMMIRWWEHSEKGVMDGQTDGQTDRAVPRAVWSQLKIPHNTGHNTKSNLAFHGVSKDSCLLYANRWYLLLFVETCCSITDYTILPISNLAIVGT